jgi:integrase
MLENGVQMKVVSEILGHAGISITADIYSHVRPDVARGALDGLSQALSELASGR